MLTLKLIILAIFRLVGPTSFGDPLDDHHSTNNNGSDLEEWIKIQYKTSKTMLLHNVSPPGTRRGAVIASPSTEHPNYFFNWVRDSALVTNTIVTLWLKEANGEEAIPLENLIWDIADFNLDIMDTSSPCSCFGEPKFMVNGNAFTEPWGRPQNDGPSLRALTFIRYARHYLKTQFIDSGLEHSHASSHYHHIDILSRLPAMTVITRDLDYIAKVHSDICFDLWEEVNGHHFHTRLVQYAALTRGAEFIKTYLNDTKTADNYLLQAKTLLNRLTKDHVDTKGKMIRASVDVINDSKKYSNLDASVILAVLQADVSEFSVMNPYVVDTVSKIVKVMSDLYPINKEGDDEKLRSKYGDGGRLAPAIGRYPEDVYDGYGISTGNPWFLTTLAMAEYLYKLSLFKHDDSDSEVLLLQQNQPRNDQGYAMSSRLRRSLIRAGDSFLWRVKKHAGETGSMSEQFHRNTGFMEGARDLTWSYAAFLTAIWARERALDEL
ncbi:glucan 1,4-alpha-glucosidase [Synchytrium endobioticum]|uniref:glucan 1,4-alpha-glucosidase n=1 Tax=Synchytrium endobioticum TaxID=286115 RepID=A0A507CTN8_9FUNG|nr:glucan 1,4-alpha-glucosidase [Synchytrium endobioticum]TPX42401.1 glucan 1,4-alpha-glucosidase [Synchytrium endobioticum]